MNRLQRFIANQLIKWTGGVTQNRIFVPMSKTAGERVDHDSAMTYSAVWRAVNLISESIACLPWTVRQRKIDGNGRTVTESLPNHPATALLDIQPNEEVDAFNFRQVVIAHALTWGNGYGEIVRDRSNRPAEIWQIEPERARLDRDTRGKLWYEVTNGTSPNSYIPSENMFHLKGPSFNGLMGYSVISYAARSIGVGMATEQFGADLFANGAFPSMVVEHPGQLGDKAIEHIKASIMEATGGRKKHAPFVLEEGMKAQKWTIPPEDAQFLETRKFNVAEIARWFGVPLHKLHEMEKSTFNNIEQQNIEFVTGSLMAWIKRMELEANIKLISPAMRGKVYTKLNMNALLRGDTAARGEWYKTMRDMGVFSANDILELEDRNPIGPEGDKRLVQLALTTLEKIGEEPEQPPEPPPAPTAQPGEDDDEEEDGNQQTTQKVDPPASSQNAATDYTAASALLGEILDKAGRRVSARLNDALINKKTLEDFTRYIDRFGKDQANYLENNLSPVLNAFKFDLNLDQYIAEQVQAMKVTAVECYSEKVAYLDPDPQNALQELMIKLTA